MKKKILSAISLVLCFAMMFSVMAVPAFAEGEGFAPERISVCVNGDASASRGFCWYTDAECDSLVQIFADGVDVTSTLTLKDVTCKAWEGSYMHKVTVNGLTAGKTYNFRVGDGTNWSNFGTFTTDNGDDKVNFVAIADVQAGSLENFQKGSNALSAALGMMPDADFVVNCGDFTDDSTNEEWDLYDAAFGEININTTLVPVAGNHDGLGVWNWFDNMFNLDTSESVETFDGVNYSFDYGNIHFAVLNTNDLLSVSLSQLRWLENDMNSTDKDWKIVAMHKSPYSLGKDAKWPDAMYLQDELAETLDRCNVDLVLSGHDHMYLRTKALKGGEVNEDGTVYVLAGTAGAKRYEIRSFLAGSFIETDMIGALTVQKDGYANYWNGTDWNSTKDTNVGSCFNCVSIDGGSLTFNSYILADEKAEDGSDVITNIDSFTITKETGLNVPTTDGGYVTGDIEYVAYAVPSLMNLLGYTLMDWLPKFLFMLPELLKVYITEGTF